MAQFLIALYCSPLLFIVGSIENTTLAEPADRQPGSLEIVVLQLPYYHMFNYAGFYAAVEKGYYRDERLEIKIVEGAPNFTPSEKVLNGEAHYGVQNADLLQLRLNGAPLVALAALFQHSPWALMVRADSGIHTPHDLIDRTIMLELNPRDAEITAMLLNEGVPLDRINIIKSRWEERDVIEGRGDAKLVYTNDIPFVMKQAGVPYRLIRPVSYGIDFYGDVIFTSEKELQNHPDRAAAFRRASLKGWKYALDNEDELIEIILNMPGVKARGLSRESLKSEAAGTQELMVSNIVEPGHMNPYRWQQMAETYVKLGMARSRSRLAGFVYDPTPEPNTLWIELLGAATLGLITLTALIVIWNRQLNNYANKITSRLRKSEQRYRQFVEANTAGILNVEYRPPIPVDLPARKQTELFLENSYTSEINAVLAKQLGYSSPKDCQGKNLSFHVDASDLDNIKNIRSYISSGYRSSGLTMHAKNLNGNDVYFLNNALGIVEGKMLKGTWLSLIDVTQRFQAESALRASEEKFSKAFDSSPDAITIATLRDAKYLDVNKSFERISGYRKDEVLGRTPFELNLWNEPHKLDRMRESLRTRAEIRELPITLLTKSGAKRSARVSGGAIDLEGEPCLVLVIRDVTEKIRLEKKSRRQELQLIQANKMTALGTLLSGVGHEINNPNNLVMMNGQILQDVWPDISRVMEHYRKDNPLWQLAGLPYDELKSTLPSLIADIKESAQRIQNIVGTLRDFARSGQSDERKIQANDAVERALPLLQHLVRRHTNHFHLQPADNLPPIRGNAQKIEQVIVNLVINALESLSDREHAVKLSTRYNPAEKMVEIEVADEGTGMTDDVSRQLLCPVWRQL